MCQLLVIIQALTIGFLLVLHILFFLPFILPAVFSLQGDLPHH